MDSQGPAGAPLLIVEPAASMAHAGDDLPYWVALHRVHRLGSVRFAVLESAFPTLRDA